jgi:hypothetical protein
LLDDDRHELNVLDMEVIGTRNVIATTDVLLRLLVCAVRASGDRALGA